MMPAAEGTLLDLAFDDLVYHLAHARERVALAIPFLSHAVAEELASRVQRSAASDRRLLVALTARSTAAGFLSAQGLVTLLDADFELRSAVNLHAKVALIDNDWGLVGSGNLTVPGLKGGNVELGVVLSAAQRSAASKFFDDWWTRATPVHKTDLDPYLAWTPLPPEHGALQDFGARLPAPVPRGVRDRLEAAEPTNNRWMKMLYSRPGRDDAYWSDADWISDAHYIGADGEPKRRPSYSVGDRLVFYVTDEKRCPAIVEATSVTNFDPDFVNRYGDPGDGQRWGWVTRVKVIQHVPMLQAPTLGDLGVAPNSVRQQGRIRLTTDQFARAERLIAP